jgi:hypothetical protein
MSVLKDITTSKDGESFNFAKILGIVVLVLFIGASIYCYIIKANPFDAVTWTGVLTGIYGVINGAIRATHVTEPDQ